MYHDYTTRYEKRRIEKHMRFTDFVMCMFLLFVTLSMIFAFSYGTLKEKFDKEEIVKETEPSHYLIEK